MRKRTFAACVVTVAAVWITYLVRSIDTAFDVPERAAQFVLATRKPFESLKPRRHRIESDPHEASHFDLQAQATAGRAAHVVRFDAFADLNLAREDCATFVARQHAIARCMKARGFDYVHESHGADAEDAIPNHRSSDERTAYQLAKVGDLASVELAAAKHGPSTSRDIAKLQLDNGTAIAWDRRSCTAEADRILYGDDVEAAVLRHELSTRATAIKRVVESDARVIAALERWQSCTLRHGVQAEVGDDLDNPLGDSCYSETDLAQTYRLATQDARASVDPRYAAFLGKVRNIRELAAVEDTRCPATRTL